MLGILDLQVLQALLEPELLDQLARQVPRVMLDLLAPPDPQELKAILGILVISVLPVLQVR